jgi:5-methylcytosine-specific restriction protein A
MPRTVAEWIGKNDDTRVPDRVRDRVRLRDGNACRSCGRDLGAENAECDHFVAIINGGENRESNLRTLCVFCHKKKTKADSAKKFASYKRRKRHYGIKGKRSSFRTNKDQPFKKKISGEVVKR